METVRTASTHYIAPGKFLLVENALGNPDLIQSSVASDCRVTIVDNVNFDLDELEQWPTFPLRTTNIKLTAGPGAYHIYIVVPAKNNTTASSASIGYSTKELDRNGCELLADGNSGMQIGPENCKFYLAGKVFGQGSGADGGRRIEMDLGMVPPVTNIPGDMLDYDKIFQIDKVDVTNPNSWLLTILSVIKSMTARVINVTEKLVFKFHGNELPIEDVAISTDSGNEEKINDGTLATTGWTNKEFEKLDEKFISKIHDDTVDGNITFRKDIHVEHNAIVDNDSEIRGNLTVGNDTNTPSLTADRFVEGWLGEGGRLWYDPVTGKTKLEVDEIRARDVFETLTFRFNQVDVISGEMWSTFAFGTIKSVDTEKKIVNLDLVDGELMTVKPNDLLRGVFHHLTGANNASDGVDDCGFPKIQGFTTSYFTPVSLLPDGTGFRYALRAGTTVHPQPGMKFAAYGNFTDKSRQSSTYSTRTRLIMLDGVNTWVIDPARHYQYVRGELNMEYGGMKFDGHGTIQKNSYIYGSQIFFTDKDKEELQGESAYSVNLSDYEGIVTLDLDGNIVDGVRQTQNVVTGDLNVTTDNETLNVVTNGYRLSSRIQAFKGKKELFYSEEFTEGGFTVRLYPVGCTAIVENGILEITSISNPDSCHVDIEVNCEGEAVFTKTYKVTAVTNGYSPLYMDLDNEMDSVACDSDGKVLFGLPLVANVSMFYGSKKLVLKTLSVLTESGVTFTATKETGRIAITYIPDNTAASFAVHINATADYDGKEYSGSAVFTVNKVKTSAIYNLLPSVSDIKVERNKDNGLVYKTTSVSCKVRKNDGTQTAIPSELPAGMYIRLSADKGTETAYSYGTSVSVTSLLTSIEFRLYNSADTLIDTETIPVVVDGSNGESNVIADLDNEMDSVACDAEGNWLFGNPQATVGMYYGSTKLTLDSLSLDADYGVNATSNASTGLVRVTSVDKAAKDVSQIRITLKATYKGEQYTRMLTFTINKVKTSAIYNLQPSVSAVKKAADGTPTVSSVSCKVRKYDGVTTDTMTALPSGYTMKYSTDDGAETAYTYGNNVSVSTIQKKIQFLLYYGGNLVDVETVPVVSDGKKGEDGEPGKDGVSSFKSTVFLRSNTAPATPSGGSFASPVPTSSPAWSDGIPAGAAMLWASTRIFSFDGQAPQQSGWSKPAQMTDTADFDVEFSSLENPNPPVGHPNTNSQWGNASGTSTVWMATSRCKNGAWSGWEVSKIKGEKGDAGTGIQLKGSKPAVGDLPKTGNTVGDCYTVNGALYVWDGDSWENAGNIKGEPGTPGATPYIHIKFSDDGKTFTANNGETPGKYMGVLVDYNVGDSGVFNAYTWNKFRGDDGYFYEYIYKRTTTAAAPATPATSSQTDDYVPAGWTDDPAGVSVDYPYEWQCYRKKESGVWGAFIGSHADNTKAVLWAKYGDKGEPGKDGVSSFKSTVFLRSNTAPATPSGGSFASPVPTSSPAWSDGIPAGAAMLWASTRIFSFDGQAPQQSGWSKPAQMTDTADFDVEFSSLENPNPPVGHPNTNSQWGNASGTSTVWMATSRCKNGAWSGWEVSKIKGEKGDAGTGIQLKGSKPAVGDLPKTGNTVGDCYTVNGTLYVWDGDSWEGAGNIKGEPGTPGATPYIHIKFSDDGKTFTANNGETPGKYMGVLVDYNVGDSGVFNAYTWNKFRGDDGYFYEYIYKRTTTAAAPATPATSSQSDDYVPAGWTDDPAGVSVDYPYEWQCYRKKESGVWGAFIGSHADNTKAVLWAKYGDKGEPGKDGVSSFKSTVFLRSNTAPATPSGGSFASPVPTSSPAWSDGIPAGAAMLWASTRIFSFDGQAPQQSGWSKPAQMTDTADFDVEFSSLENPNPPVGHPNTNSQWGNASGTSTVWMATSRCKNGAWSDWEVSKIKGEKGENGEPGNGIASETVYYLATSQTTGVSTSTAGWTTSYPQISKDKKYLWSYTLTKYTDGTQNTDGPKLIGVYGDTGLQGCIMRMFEEGIVVGQFYHNDIDNQSAVYRYIDHVAIPNDKYQSGYAVYRCKSNASHGYTAVSVEDYNNATYWEAVEMNANAAFFTYLLAKNAYIKMLSGASMVVQGEVQKTDPETGEPVMDGNGDPVMEIQTRGGMQGDDTKPIFWAGADERLMEDAPYRVMADGTVYLGKMEAQGRLTAGDKDGQRIEINPETKNIIVFDADGNECATMDGNTYTPSEILPDGTYEQLTTTANTGGSLTSLVGAQRESVQYSLSQAAYTDKQGVLTADFGAASLSLSAMFPPGGGTTVLVSFAMASVYFYLESYSDESLTALISKKTLGGLYAACSTDNVSDSSSASPRTVRMSVGKGWHILKAELSCQAGKVGSKSVTATAKANWKLNSAKIVSDVYISRFFGNGICLSKSMDNYLMAIVENGYMNVSVASGGRKFAINNGSMTVNGAKQPVTVFAGLFTYTGSLSLSKLFSASGSYSYSRTGTGRYIVALSDPSFTSIYNAFVTATGYGRNYNGNSPIKATVYGVTMPSSGKLSLEIHISDDETENDGGFYLKVEVFN